MLELNLPASKVPENPLLGTWMNFVKFFNTEKKYGQKTSLLATVTMYYDDEDVANLVESASKTSSTVDFAKRLESELTQRWLGSKSPHFYVLRQLNLNKERGNLFASPQLRTWT